MADDLTGANATAAGFARAGMRAVSVATAEAASTNDSVAARYDVVVVCLDNRHSPPDEAAQRVAETVRAAWPVRLVCNRIDTTLRGNVGASTQAVLRTVCELSGQRAVALCLPAHPAAGRHTVEGVQLLEGKRLEETELARDPRSPVPTSDVAALLRSQADLRTAHVPLSVVTAGPDRLCATVRQAVASGADVVIADALTEEHLQQVAHAAVSATGGDVRWVAVDPGPGSLALARALGVGGRGARAPLLAVSGSATALTRTQLTRLISDEQVTVVRPVPDGAVPDAGRTGAALAAALDATDPTGLVLLVTALDASDVRKLAADDAAALPHALATATRRVLEQRTVDGLYATGGDVTAALVTALGADGVEVSDEVVPLAVAGTLVGGRWDGIPIVTKGGLVGDASTAVACVNHLRQMADARRHHTRATGVGRDERTTHSQHTHTEGRP